jgi:hypothetical protein
MPDAKPVYQISEFGSRMPSNDILICSVLTVTSASVCSDLMPETLRIKKSPDLGNENGL